MPTIRDVVAALAGREGVQAVVVLGRDGLPIDAKADGLDADGVAALIPSVVAACTRLGNAANRGEFGTGVVEFGKGSLIISAVNADTLMAMVVMPDTNIGSLLYEMRRHRGAIAGLL